MKHRLLGALALSIGLAVTPAKAATEILNASYDIARELFAEINPKFQSYWKAETGEDVTIRQSHAGTSRQARAIIEGLQADVVTFNQYTDIEMLAKNGLIAADWKSRLPHDSSPYYSAPAFLVRKGNPKNLKDWGDLVRPDVQVITPNPKTSGGARWNLLAAWAWARKQYGSDEKAQEYVAQLYKQVPVLDTGARGSTITFVNNKIGDVLLAWENEAFLALKEEGGDALEIVVPSLSILAEPPVTVVDRNVERNGTRELATAYLNYLYSEEGQRIAAKNFYRPRNAKVAAEFRDQFPELELVTIDEAFNGWKEAQPKFFGDGGIFDQIYQAH